MDFGNHPLTSRQCAFLLAGIVAVCTLLAAGVAVLGPLLR